MTEGILMDELTWVWKLQVKLADDNPPNLTDQEDKPEVPIGNSNNNNSEHYSTTRILESKLWRRSKKIYSQVYTTIHVAREEIMILVEDYKKLNNNW